MTALYSRAPVHNVTCTVIFRSVGTCPSVPRSAPRSVFRDPYCTVRIAEHRTRRGARNGQTCSNGTENNSIHASVATSRALAASHLLTAHQMKFLAMRKRGSFAQTLTRGLGWEPD